MLKLLICAQLALVYVCSTEATSMNFADLGGYICNPFSSICMRLVEIEKSWEDAKDYCEAEGEYLATFDTLESASWFINVRQTHIGWTGFNVWLGGTKSSSNSVWYWRGLNTGLVHYSQWAEGQPDGGSEYCLESDYDYTRTHKYNDARCSSLNYFVCETSF